MNKTTGILKGIADKIVLVIYGAVVIYLFYIAGFSTAVITSSQKTYIIADSFWLNLLALAIVIAGSALLVTKVSWFRGFVDKVNEDKAFSDRCRQLGLWLIGLLSVLAVLIFQNEPKWDQSTIYRVADLLIDNNPSAMFKGGYMDVFANNNGIILMLYLLSLLFGSYNFLVIRLINVICIVRLYRNMAEITDLAGRKRITGLIVIVTGVLFAPAILYTNYCYGIIIGLTFIVASFRRMMEYFTSDTHKKRDAVLCILYALLALITKSNYLIFVIAMVLYGIYMLIQKFGAGKLIVTISLILTLLLSGPLVSLGVRAVTGQWPSQGITYLAWIAMGMQDCDTKYYGWYNSYNWNAAEKVGFNNDELIRVSRAFIDERLEEFKNDPSLALEFYSGKNSSQWNNPDFQSFWSSAYTSGRLEPSKLVSFLISPQGVDKVNSAMNILQFLILAGALGYVLLERKRDASFIFLGAVVIGGFIFHTLWEAKAQYTLPYFMMLFPVSAAGFVRIVEMITPANKVKKDKKSSSTFKELLPVLIVLIGAVVIELPVPAFATVFKRNSDAPLYKQYLADSRSPYIELEDGDYLITTAGDGVYGFQRIGISAASASEERIFLNVSAPYTGQKYEIRTSSADEHVYIRFCDTDKCLGITGDAEENALVQALKMNGLTDQQWLIRRSSDGSSYNILFNDRLALTFDEISKTVILSAYTDSPDQRWDIRPQQ